MLLFDGPELQTAVEERLTVPGLSKTGWEESDDGVRSVRQNHSDLTNIYSLEVQHSLPTGQSPALGT